MFKWDSVFVVGQAGVGRNRLRARHFCRDTLLETVIAHEGIEVLYQPLIEPRTGRIVGAEALARSSIAASAERCSRGLQRPRSANACRGSSSARRCAAPPCGKAR